jgi:AcrR family transcriptional regulator
MSRRATAARSRETTSTRDVILDAAERRFAERGFAGVSVREIATDAGLKNQASLYHHFRHKRALYEAVLTRGIEPILAVVAESSAPANAGKGSEQFIDRMVVYLAEHPHVPRLIQRAGLEDRRYLPSAVPRLLRPLFQQGIQALNESSGAGWPAAELPHLGMALYLMIFGYFANAALFESVTQRDPRSPAAVQRQRRFLRAAIGRLLDAQRPGPRIAR